MIRIRPMTDADLPLGMRLKTQAGWNQTEADWRRILALQPGGCFVAELDGCPAATTSVCVFDSIGWIAMVLVEQSVRGRGIATRLMQHALAFLDGCRVRTVRLDATPLGRPVYEKFGFVAEYQLARWQGTAAGGEIAPGVDPVTPQQIEAVCALDRRATGTDRRRLIARLHEEQPAAMRVSAGNEGIRGYMSLRPGSRATQIGPVVALDARAGRVLCDAAACLCAGQPVFVDIPSENHPATEWAESTGLSVQRPLTRMRRGEPVLDQPMQLWGGFGPEKG
jgi:GNAT superfamily N-acetyltransferase